MAGSCTITEPGPWSCKKVTFAWVSAAGSSDATTTNAYDGNCIGFTTIPDGVAAPAANYDIRILDSDGHDVLLGAGANRHDANTEHVGSGNLSGVCNSRLTLEVRNTGGNDEGDAILWIR